MSVCNYKRTEAFDNSKSARPGLGDRAVSFTLFSYRTQKFYYKWKQQKNTLFKCYYLLKKTTIRGCPFRLFTNLRIVFSLKISAAISANEGLLTMLRLF